MKHFKQSYCATANITTVTATTMISEKRQTHKTSTEFKRRVRTGSKKRKDQLEPDAFRNHIDKCSDVRCVRVVV